MSRLAIGLLLVAMVSIQLGAALAKQLFPIVGAGGVSVLRTSFAALFLLGLWRPWRGTWTKSQIRLLAFYGIALGAMNLLFYLALQTLPLGMAVALEFTGPLALSLFSSRKLLDLLWVFLAALGIYLILPHGELETAADPTGVMFVLGAGFFWAVYIWFGKKAGENTHGGQSTAIGMTFAALTVLPFGVYQAGERLFHWSILPIGLAVALLSSAIPYSLEMNALKKIPVKTFGILMSLEPVVATIAGAIFLHEHLTATQIVSIACIVLASFGSSLFHREPVL
jgi:inner membrane transporter RhtA